MKIDDNLLDWIGYSGDYRTKKANIAQLLKQNSHIECSEIVNEHFAKI